MCFAALFSCFLSCTFLPVFCCWLYFIFHCSSAVTLLLGIIAATLQVNDYFKFYTVPSNHLCKKHLHTLQTALCHGWNQLFLWGIKATFKKKVIYRKTHAMKTQIIPPISTNIFLLLLLLLTNEGILLSIL